MTQIAALLAALAVSVEGFWSGSACGLRQARLRSRDLVVIALVSAGGAALALTGGQALHRTAPAAAAKWASAALFLAIGVTMLYEARLEGGRRPSSAGACPTRLSGWEACALGLAAAMNASLAAFALGLAGHASGGLPLLLGVMHSALAWLGGLAGDRGLTPRLTASRLAYLPGGVLVALGLLRFC